MEKLVNWQATSALAGRQNIPIVVMVDQSDCPYCRRVESDFFAGIFASGEYQDKAIFGKISIDSGETIVSVNGEVVSTRKFLNDYNADFTPTILFLDSEMKELEERIIGLTTPDFYGYYLEKAIKSAIQTLKNTDQSTS